MIITQTNIIFTIFYWFLSVFHSTVETLTAVPLAHLFWYLYVCQRHKANKIDVILQADNRLICFSIQYMYF